MGSLTVSGKGTLNAAASLLHGSGLKTAGDLTITDKTVDAAIKKAQDADKNNGTAQNGIAVEINVVAVYINEIGKVEYITNSSYNVSSGKLLFTTDHFSTYGVAYKEDIPVEGYIKGSKKREI